MKRNSPLRNRSFQKSFHSLSRLNLPRLPTTTDTGTTGTNPPSLDEARAKLTALDRRHGKFYDALTDGFSGEVQEQTTKSVATLVSELQSQLTFDSLGKIERTPANLQIIGRLDQRFEALMNEYGYSKTLTAFVGSFPNQLPLLREELDLISDFGYHGGPLKRGPLVHSPVLASSDLTTLAAQQRLTKNSLLDIVATVGDLAKRKAMLSIGGLGMRQMTDLLVPILHRAPGECRTLGATSLAIFYRTANSRAIEKIEEDGQNQRTLYYVYEGPDDKLTRPFCHKLKQAKKVYTREDIARLDNGQLPDVWTTCGGYNCRHQWRIALPGELPVDIKTQQDREDVKAREAAAKPKPPAPPPPEEPTAEEPKPKKPKQPKKPAVTMPPIEHDADYLALVARLEQAKQLHQGHLDDLEKWRADMSEFAFSRSGIVRNVQKRIDDAAKRVQEVEQVIADFQTRYAKEGKFRAKLARQKGMGFSIAPITETAGAEGDKFLDNLTVDLQMKFPKLAASIDKREIAQRLSIGQQFMKRDFPDDKNVESYLGLASRTTQRMWLKTTGHPHTPGAPFNGSHTVAETQQNNRDFFLAVVVHELGHLFHFRYEHDLGDEVGKLYRAAMQTERVITRYGKTDAFEYFTESFTAMLFDPQQLRKVDPKMFKFVKAFMVEKGIL